MTPPPAPFVTVPRLWPESLVVCLGSGPSLTPEDVEACRGRARVIAINTSWTLAPWADALYAADAKWWQWAAGAPAFTGLKYTIEPQRQAWPDLQVVRNLGVEGLSRDPAGLTTGRNSGAQAIGLAVHLGARRILLLGYDMHVGPKGRGHWHPPHPDATVSPYALFLAAFPTMVAPLREAGVTVINCTPGSALTCFPRGNLHDELAQARQAA